MRSYRTRTITMGFILAIAVSIANEILSRNVEMFTLLPEENSRLLPLAGSIAKTLGQVKTKLLNGVSNEEADSTAMGPAAHRTVSPTTANRNFSTLCATSDGKPNPALTECLLQAIHSIPNETIPKNISMYNPNFSIDIHKEILELLEVFDRLMTSHNLTYFLAAGTLMGSWRHHGCIPWDDDADVFMDVTDRPKIQEALSQLPSRYTCYANETFDEMKLRWKVHITKRHKRENSTTRPWASPFLDILFYRTNETHIEDIDYAHYGRTKYEIGLVFPLVPRPFYHLSLPAPRDTAKIIRQDYGGYASLCTSRWYNHLTRQSEPKLNVPCSDLYPYFPFVKHTTSSLGHLESLMIGGHIVYSVETNTVGELH